MDAATGAAVEDAVEAEIQRTLRTGGVATADDLRRYHAKCERHDARIRAVYEAARLPEPLEAQLTTALDNLQPTVREYVTRRLADTIHGGVKWTGEGPRDKADWYAAERCLRDRAASIRRFSEEGIVLIAYSTLPMGMIEPLVTARRVRAKALLKKPGFEGLGEFIDEYVPEWIHCKGDMTSMPRELVAGGLRRGEVLMAIPEVLQEMEYQDRESIIFKGYFQPMMSHPELRAEVLADPNYDIWRQ